MDRPGPPTRADFVHFLPITTRWLDNDAFGHVNNTVYYTWFDTAVNRVLTDNGLLDVVRSDVIGVVAENGCRFFSQVAYPDPITVGLVVARLGQSSVTYALGIFRADDAIAAACGHFVHVFVHRTSMRPVAMPDAVRTVMATLQAR